MPLIKFDPYKFLDGHELTLGQFPLMIKCKQNKAYSVINPEIFPLNVVRQRSCQLNDSFSDKEKAYEHEF